MIKRIKKILEQYGWHTFLLPVFFVLHNYLQYYGLVSAGAVLGTGAAIELIFAAFFLLLLLITRHAGRSLQITTLLGFIALFYGVIKDFFNGTAGLHFMAKYSVLLPLLIVLSIAAIMVIRKKKDFRKANLFQNGLLLLFILLDSVLLLRSGAGFFMQQNRLVKNNLLNPDTLAIPARRPDVYFLVFDSYPGTGFLHDNVQFDNTPFDSILRKKGFYVVAHPKSNYSRTAFSIAATLNFEYLQNIPAGKKPEPKHYSQASLSIERSAVTTVFTHLGYHIYNLSFFDFTGYPALKRENFMVLPERRMLLYNTLGERFGRDVLWHFPFLKYGIHVAEKEKIL
ncbi:MAG TPA: hypothetical protein VLD19_04250, partial [Chitinophagaceae bacterium]|nr:hypothetical protein [Chitinophagaceae bacterium]